jgi:uncharacterized repeat protein (TIGR03803 family)
MYIRDFVPALALAASLSLVTFRSPAQMFSALHSFTALSNGTNSDGTAPYATLVLSGNRLYGTTSSGGANSNGTVFAVNADGTGFTNLHTFTARTGLLHTNADGAQCFGGVVLSGNTLYGTTGGGGSVNRGTIFAVNTDGSGFTNLHNFNGNSEGSATIAKLVLSSNTLYGASQSGGSNGFGNIFEINIDGTGYASLHAFPTLSGSTNTEGGQPLAGMIVSENTLFGTTVSGGFGGKGTVFRINADGTGFTNLHNFTALVSGTNSDGAQPFGGLALGSNVLFGATFYGGTSSNGALFRMNTDGSGFTNFHSFTALSNGTNSDGANPYESMFLSGNTLYGTASAGGSGSNGTVFVVNTDGSGFKTLYNFTPMLNGTNSDGTAPVSGVLWSNVLYGLAHAGGNASNGTVFSLFIPPPLAMSVSGVNVILSWPTNADGFSLQFSTNLAIPTAWSAVPTTPTNINGLNVETNSRTDQQIFYRLAR